MTQHLGKLPATHALCRGYVCKDPNAAGGGCRHCLRFAMPSHLAKALIHEALHHLILNRHQTPILRLQMGFPKIMSDILNPTKPYITLTAVYQLPNAARRPSSRAPAPFLHRALPGSHHPLRAALGERSGSCRFRSTKDRIIVIIVRLLSFPISRHWGCAQSDTNFHCSPHCTASNCALACDWNRSDAQSLSQRFLASYLPWFRGSRMKHPHNNSTLSPRFQQTHAGYPHSYRRIWTHERTCGLI